MNEELLNADVEMDELVELHDEPKVRDEQKAHSHTRLKMKETCDWKYWATYIDKRKGNVNPLMLIGRVAHDAIMLYIRFCLKEKVTSAFDKWEIFVRQALEDENLPAEFHPEVFRMVKSYCDSHEIDLESVVGAEEKIALNREYEQVDWMSEDVFFRAVLDLVQISGTVCKITDFKTGYNMKLDDFQLKIYAWVVKKLYPHVTDFQLEYDYIRFDYQYSITLTEDDLEEVERTLLTRIANVEKTTKFEPNVGIQCADCALWYCCPAMRKSDALVRLPTNVEEATLLAIEHEKTAKVASEIKKVLKAFCDSNGPFEAGGRTYEFKVNRGYEFDDFVELYGELHKLNIDLFEYVNIDFRKFNSLMGNEAVEKVAKKLGRKTVGVNFSTAKTKKKEVKKDNENPSSN